MFLRKLYPELADPRLWRDWWKPPPCHWWLALKKNQDRPWYYIVKSPLLAHTIGVMVPFWIAYPVPGVSPWGAAAIGIGVVFKGQLQKADALLPDSYNARNVIWRTIIAAVMSLGLAALL